MSDPRNHPGADAGVLQVVRRPSRLRALAALEANAESSAQALDRIAAMACRVLDVPVALVNLVGADRQRFVGCGTADEPWASTREMPVTAGFCPFTIRADDAYSFADAREDPALATDPAVEQFGVVAYAGVPLRAADGEPVGTLCAVDSRPREWSRDDLQALSDLAASATAELQLLTATARNRVRLRALAALSGALAPPVDARAVAAEVSRAAEPVDPNAVSLLLLDGARENLVTAAGDAVALDSPLSPAQVLRSGRSEFLATRAAVRERCPVIEDVLPAAQSVAVLPLAAGEQRIGVLCVCFADECAFSSEDRDYLAALAAIAALALDRVPR